MKSHFTSTRLSAGFLGLFLCTVILSACAPAASPTVVPSPASSSTPLVEVTPFAQLTVTPAPELPSATPPNTMQPVATSRGPNLEATDPTTVNLASGGLQLVEFFRFT